MKKTILHKTLVLAGMFAILSLWSSCERLENVKVDKFDCYECYEQKPEWVRLNVSITINSENQVVPLTVYVGNIEDGVVDWIDTAYSANYWVDVKPDRYYSIVAEYKEGNSVVLAVDGDKIKLKQNTTDCDGPCYYQVGGYIDVRLR